MHHGTVGVDDPVAVYPCDDAACAVIRPLVYAKDHLNSVEALYDVAAQQVASYGYSTFGVPTGSVPSLQPYTYTAREWERTSQMYGYRHRHYDPNTGQFLQMDPVGSQASSRYTYAFQNPTNYIDPFGLKAHQLKECDPCEKTIRF